MPKPNELDVVAVLLALWVYRDEARRFALEMAVAQGEDDAGYDFEPKEAEDE